MILLDYETFSEAKLGRSTEAVTAAAYAEHPSTSILCTGYRQAPTLQGLLATPTRIVRLGEKWPAELEYEMHMGDGPVFAWNVGFEWAITLYVMGIEIDDARWRDIMAAAAYASMPQSLDEFGKAAGLNVVKDKEGHKVMMKLARPRKPTKNNAATRWLPRLMPTQALREKVIGEFNVLYRYCGKDIDTEAEALDLLRWTPCLAF